MICRPLDSAFIDYCFSKFSDRSSDYWIGCPVPIARIPVSRGKETIPIPGAENPNGYNFLYVFLVPNQASDSSAGVAIDVQPVP